MAISSHSLVTECGHILVLRYHKANGPAPFVPLTSKNHPLFAGATIHLPVQSLHFLLPADNAPTVISPEREEKQTWTQISSYAFLYYPIFFYVEIQHEVFHHFYADTLTVAFFKFV